jgi:rhodanese-related sulfurtransferase
MSDDVPRIARDELRERIGSADGLVVVDALPPMSFAVSHLPGAINLPPERVSDLAAKLIPQKESEIVVYCASETCDSSLETARALYALGYTNVRHYLEGKKDWMQAGLPVERARR